MEHGVRRQAKAANLRRVVRGRLALSGWVVGAVLALGCAGTSVEEVPSAALFYSKGEKVLEGYSVFGLFTSIDYPRAVSLFQEVIDNYPFSEYAPLAELQLAEINEQMGRFEEAASFYQDFVELHPNHPRVPYALYQLSGAYIAQMRDPDQDQDVTRKALAQLEFLTTRYARTEYAEKGVALLQKARDQLALREATIAEYYYGNGQYHAAVPRYEAALEQSDSYEGHCENRAQLGLALSRLGLRAQAARVVRELRMRCSDAGELEEIEPTLNQIESARN